MPLLSRERFNHAVLQPAQILVADDLEPNRQLLIRILTSDGHVVHLATDGDEALRLMETQPIDLVPARRDDAGPERLRSVPGAQTPAGDAADSRRADHSLQDSESKVRGIDAGADDFITKPFSTHELRARVHSLIRMKRYTDDLDPAESVIMSLALTIEARDATTDGHCQRLACTATTLGTALA